MSSQAAIAPVAPTTAVTSTKTKKEREQLLADIQAALAPYGVRTEITPYSNRHLLADFITPQIRANIDLDADDAEPSMIHWYRATANLKAVQGTFDEADINASHRRKATSFPPTRSEEHTSELQSLMRTSYAAFCLNKPQRKTR